MHAYEQLDDGAIKPRHFVEMKSRPDELRPTRITDLRKWWKEGRKVEPSVTEVMKVLNKYALNRWMVEQHIQTAWEHDELIREAVELEEYKAEIKRLTELRLDIAPQAGSDLHEKLELYANDALSEADADYELCVDTFKLIEDRTGILRQSWKPEERFVHELGFGGQADLVSEGWVIDFKTKQTADKFKPGKMAYPEHSMQLAAYREGFCIPGARCANIFLSLEDGQLDFHEHSEAAMEKGWNIFSHALEIWRLQNRVQ